MDDQMLHHFMQDLIPIIVLPVMIIAAAWVISLIIAAFRQRATLRAQVEFQNRVLDKFGSAAEFTAYLQSTEGRVFFENLPDEPSAPLVKILSSIKIGTIMLILGGGFFVLSLIAKTEDSVFALDILAVVAATLGIGFLVSSAISYRLAKSWGFIQPPSKSNLVEEPAATAAP